MQIIWSFSASKDFDLAIEYIKKQNIFAAESQLDKVLSQTMLLIEHPDIGRPGRLSGTRELIINRTLFILIYRIKKDIIQILKFLHGAQQWPTS